MKRQAKEALVRAFKKAVIVSAALLKRLHQMRRHVVLSPIEVRHLVRAEVARALHGADTVETWERDELWLR